MRGRTLAESESAAPENGETVDGFDHAHDGLLQLLLRDEESREGIELLFRSRKIRDLCEPVNNGYAYLFG